MQTEIYHLISSGLHCQQFNLTASVSPDEDQRGSVETLANLSWSAVEFPDPLWHSSMAAPTPS